MMQRALVTPIATEKGSSIPSGNSDTENETRNRNRNNDSSSNTIWKNRRPHNPSSVPIPLLAPTPPRRKGHRLQHREDPLKQPSSTTKTSANTSSSLVSRRTLLAMFLIFAVCVVLEVILIDSFLSDNYTLRVNGRKKLLHALLPINKSRLTKTVHPKKEADAVSISVIPPPSIAATTTDTDTNTSTTNRSLRKQHGQRRPVLIDEIGDGFRA